MLTLRTGTDEKFVKDISIVKTFDSNSESGLDTFVYSCVLGIGWNQRLYGTPIPRKH
jgi:hypothetical protein